MTDKEAFEEWFAEKADTGYVQRVKSVALWAWQAAVDHERGKAPAWHDAPDVPGLWVWDRGPRKVQHLITVGNLQDYLTREPTIPERWFGPIPEDKP